ncbi:RAVE subunit 2/Rogdi [Mucor mucedo]|uniref:RAVE subunit 2/Rogdi n=1 Tax=Mucor mucedo TaxID=29922 RepID=UPI00221EFB38|nr:RAVE subunit 2/Rogdi [Mucor mucedo]KAI7885442.1 RAVE subunit 2/Rogdi [Mucor mucedo]
MHTTEEHITAVKQREWLLHSVIPPMLKKLLSQLEKSQDILTSQTKIDSLPITQNDTIKGVITLTGSHITKAELQIKLPNYQDTPIKATIVNTTPYFLEQAQQATNYISLAINEIRTFIRPSYKQATIELLEAMYQYVDRALHAFDYPNEASLFPYKVCHPKFFSPSLKQDIAIEFCIHDVFITCNVYALDYNYIKHGIKVDSQHAVVTYKDKQVMILDEVRTQTQSPTLTELKSLLKLILEWCQTYKQMLLQIEA